MADGMHELRAFAADLGKIASSALDDVDKIAKKAAQNLKDDYAAEAAGSTHFSSVGPSWSYDPARGVGSVGYVVGPDKGRAGGALANLYYFGSPRGGGGTGDIDGPLDREAPQMMRALDDYLGRLL